MQDIERKLGRQSNKTDSITLNLENKFAKVTKEIKKVSKDLFKAQTSGPASSGLQGGALGGSVVEGVALA